MSEDNPIVKELALRHTGKHYCIGDEHGWYLDVNLDPTDDPGEALVFPSFESAEGARQALAKGGALHKQMLIDWREHMDGKFMIFRHPQARFTPEVITEKMVVQAPTYWPLVIAMLLLLSGLVLIPISGLKIPALYFSGFTCIILGTIILMTKAFK